MPGKIFISYRRDDVAGDARSIRDGLAARFGRHSVFMDVDDLLLGQRFDRELAKALDGCDVLIAVIGPRWMELLKAKVASRERDYVRLEIAEALRRGIVVVPVLMGRIGQMPALPAAENLPEDIRDLTWHQKHDVTHERFGRDLADLGDGIAEVRQRLRPPKPAVAWRWVAAAAGAVVLSVAVWALWPVGGPTAGGAPAPVVAGPNASKVPSEVLPPMSALKRLSPTRPAVALTAEEERGLKLKDSFKECSACPEMVVVPAGEFTMGSPETEEGHAEVEAPQRTIKISKPLGVGRYEVSFREWDACVAENACNAIVSQDAGWGRGEMPAIRLTWHEAKAFVGWLNRKTNRKKYRMLSEAEWEYVARAGTETPFWWRSSISPDDANYDSTYAYADGPKVPRLGRPLPVNSFKANPFGLKNVLGNVSEWVEDCGPGNYKDRPIDGSASTTGDCSSRMHRGGAWSTGPAALRAAGRAWNTPSTRARDLGLRVARDLDLD